MSRRPRKPRARTDEPSAKPSSAILALQRELQGRFVSSGGRPADLEPTIRRLVPVRARIWKELAIQASRLSRLGPRVSAGQLAALLLERGLSELHLSSAAFDETDRRKSFSSLSGAPAVAGSNPAAPTSFPRVCRSQIGHTQNGAGLAPKCELQPSARPPPVPFPESSSMESPRFVSVASLLFWPAGLGLT